MGLPVRRSDRFGNNFIVLVGPYTDDGTMARVKRNLKTLACIRRGMRSEAPLVQIGGAGMKTSRASPVKDTRISNRSTESRRAGSPTRAA